MRRDVTIGVILIAAVVSGGCVVSKGLYDKSVMEAEDAKANLERVQTQKNALKQEVKGLWNQNEELAVDVELAKAELQRIKDSRDKERATTEGRLKELVERTKGLSTHYRTLYKAHERVNSPNPWLRCDYPQRSFHQRLFSLPLDPRWGRQEKLHSLVWRRSM